MHKSQQKDNLRWRLKLIFLYYASYADKNNYKLLKSQNYKRFLIDSQSVLEHNKFPPFDIAFRKVHSTAIKLQQFLDILPSIAQLVYTNKNRKDAFTLYINDHMEKLYMEILQHSEFGSDFETIQNISIQKKSLELVNGIAIQKVYHKYIESTSIHQKEPEQTFEQLHLFLSEFDISPKLVYKAMTYLAFYYQLEVSQTKVWALHNLQQLLVCFAELYWKKIQDQDCPQEDKVFRLLQHMETSPGFKKIADKFLKENAMVVSFFKKQQKMALDLRDSREKLTHSRERQDSTRGKVGAKYSSAKREKTVDISPILEMLQSQNDLLPQLKTIFERLCSHGEVGNNNTLKSIKIKRYFKSLNIIKSLQQTWVDLSITQLCRTSPSGKIQFPHFVQLMQQVASKLNIDEDGFFNYIIDHSQSWPQDSHAFYSSKVTSRNVENEGKVLQILLQISKPLEKIFNHYRVGRKGMTFDQLTHFLFQFEIFPSFANKANLNAYFQNRSKATSQVNRLVGSTYLNFNGFLEVMTDISFEIGDSLSEEEKVIFLLERMQDSHGHRTLLGSEGSNLIGDLRSKYAHIYKQNLMRHSPKKQQNFQELLNDYSK